MLITSTRKKSLRTLLALATSVSLVAACGDDDAAEEPAAAEESTSEETAAAPVAEAGVLSDICPDPLVIQTDWHTESEHGALYNLLSDDYTVDKGRSATVAPMQLDGVDLGIDFEIREGGPAIGFSSPSSL